MLQDMLSEVPEEEETELGSAPYFVTPLPELVQAREGELLRSVISFLSRRNGLVGICMRFIWKVNSCFTLRRQVKNRLNQNMWHY